MIGNRILLALALCLGTASLVAPVTQVFAHSKLKSSTPENGATLSAPPKTVSLEFTHPAKVKLKLLLVEKEIPLTVSSDEATNFVVPLPVLAPGRYELRWATFGADGHAMTGTVSFTIGGS